MLEKRYDAPQIEKQIQDYWAKSETYKFRDDGREIYSIDTPPPTVSGRLHIGHIFSYTQAEMIARFHRMQGKNVYYPFGFDDNGLPTERLVEREQKVRACDLPASEFTKKCTETARKYEAEFISLWKSLGFSVDWDLQYHTVSSEVSRLSQSAFLELMRMGKAYRKESPVLWCTQCRTSIAQAELDSIDSDSAFVTVPFMVDGKAVPVATTRPELIYGCVCLFVHPEDERHINLAGKQARVPLFGFDIPILTDEQVERNKGTGIVMCATFGDSTDARWYQEHNLPYKKVILPDGFIDKSVPMMGGLSVRAARREITRLLEERGLLLGREVITHTVAVHERCGSEVEIIPSKQWYIDILSEKEQFLQAADEIEWYPAQMKNRYISWVEGLKWDWCVSRQRYFGVPIPLWYCKECGQVIREQEDRLPVNPREEGPGHACTCGCDDFIPETSVMDTWATSSLTPQINEAYAKKVGLSGLLPMSMRTQAHEIIRTWAFYTIVRSLYHTGQIPWKQIMICGFVLAKKGEKISKSKGNTAASPKELINNHGADVLRYWAAGAKLGTDTFFSQDELSEARRFITKLYNAAKFCLEQLEDYTPALPEILPATDRWMLARLEQTIQKARTLMQSYEIGLARREIDMLFWSDFCDHYLELSKDRLYNPQQRGETARRAAQYTLYHSLLGILKLYAAYMPHITEYLYQYYFRAFEKISSLHLTTWSGSCGNRLREEETALFDFGDAMKQALFTARKYKSTHNLSRNTPVDKISIQSDDRMRPLFAEAEKDILSCIRAESAEYTVLSGQQTKR